MQGYSPYLTGMRQLESSSRIVRDYFATKCSEAKSSKVPFASSGAITGIISLKPKTEKVIIDD